MEKDTSQYRVVMMETVAIVIAEMNKYHKQNQIIHQTIPVKIMDGLLVQMEKANMILGHRQIQMVPFQQG